MFFSVKHSIRIGGKVYMPCICYELTKVLELTVKDLEKQGKATIYDKMVFFQNGVIVEDKPTAEEISVVEIPKKVKKAKKEPVITKEPVIEEYEGF